MKGFPITIEIYAENEAEVADCRAALVEFIDTHRKEGRAVTAPKVASAARSWTKNPFVKRQIIEFFQ